jgi:hypothetical protein
MGDDEYQWQLRLDRPITPRSRADGVWSTGTDRSKYIPLQHGVAIGTTTVLTRTIGLGAGNRIDRRLSDQEVSRYR